METKYTPGPWEIRDLSSDFESTIQTSNGIRIAEAKSFGNDGQIFNDAPIEERRANAKLIAAAPDLLEALDGAIYLLKQNNVYIPLSIEDAIKKATE